MGRSRGGSGAKNGRDSNPKHLGVKKFAGEVVTAGSIILKQRGTKVHPGDNVMKAKDDSLFAVVDGTVVFGERKNRKIVSVSPVEA
ncbi:MAG: 50S ribosomal protein L27 [Treponema sp.]|nr:50S ribosomal protein L27 [Spirochaetia bacterium]MDD6294397.1 50S ribosomal protein L27 [Treponema sp.]MDD7450876.1 50S ribosomal protein L27 [Treponema sp.]MDY2923661.1 50S ribosomal protein L27 [Treponema sp.]MDY5684490.1 50S ribosomal protein L27 [Treponema sp.]